MSEEMKPEKANEEMTPNAEELTAKIAKLEAELSSIKQTSSQAITKANAESADWKRKYRETLDEATRKAQETEERNKAVETELANLKAEKRVASYHSKLMSVGYDDATARSMANTLPEGVDESFFEGQKAFLANMKTQVQTKALDSQPGLSSGTPPTKADAESAAIAKILAAAGIK